MRKRQSAKTKERTFNHITKQMGLEAARNRYAPALEACLLEIEQFHSRAYPECDGDCPAHNAMALARKALGR